MRDRRVFYLFVAFIIASSALHRHSLSSLFLKLASVRSCRVPHVFAVRFETNRVLVSLLFDHLISLHNHGLSFATSRMSECFPNPTRTVMTVESGSTLKYHNTSFVSSFDYPIDPEPSDDDRTHLKTPSVCYIFRPTLKFREMSHPPSQPPPPLHKIPIGIIPDPPLQSAYDHLPVFPRRPISTRTQPATPSSRSASVPPLPPWHDPERNTNTERPNQASRATSLFRS